MWPKMQFHANLVPHLCTHCAVTVMPSDPLRSCHRCGVLYCGEECQKRDWNLFSHSAYCKAHGAKRDGRGSSTRATLFAILSDGRKGAVRMAQYALYLATCVASEFMGLPTATPKQEMERRFHEVTRFILILKRGVPPPPPALPVMWTEYETNWAIPLAPAAPKHPSILPLLTLFGAAALHHVPTWSTLVQFAVLVHGLPEPLAMDVKDPKHPERAVTLLALNVDPFEPFTTMSLYPRLVDYWDALHIRGPPSVAVLLLLMPRYGPGAGATSTPEADAATKGGVGAVGLDKILAAAVLIVRTPAMKMEDGVSGGSLYVPLAKNAPYSLLEALLRPDQLSKPVPMLVSDDEMVERRLDDLQHLVDGRAEATLATVYTRALGGAKLPAGVTSFALVALTLHFGLCEHSDKDSLFSRFNVLPESEPAKK